MAESACVTCGADRSGPFCSQCGQRQPTGRNTLRGFAVTILRRSGGEEGAVNTVRQLATAPGLVIHDYWVGRTVRYVHPAAYLLLMAALFAVVSNSLGGPTNAAESDRLFLLLVIPFVAGTSRVLFWRTQYNYAEHLIAVMYLAGQVLLIATILFFGTLIVPQSLIGVYSMMCLGVGVGYFVWAYSRIFGRRPWLAAGAGLAALVLGTLGWAAAVFAIVTALRKG